MKNPVVRPRPRYDAHRRQCRNRAGRLQHWLPEPPTTPFRCRDAAGRRMAEAYVFHQLTDDDAARIAPDLTRLSEITSKDIAAYAADKDYVGQVRNA